MCGGSCGFWPLTGVYTGKGAPLTVSRCDSTCHETLPSRLFNGLIRGCTRHARLWVVYVSLCMCWCSSVNYIFHRSLPGIYVSSYFNSRIFVSANFNKYRTFIINAISGRNVNEFYFAPGRTKIVTIFHCTERAAGYITRAPDLPAIKSHFPVKKCAEK